MQFVIPAIVMAASLALGVRFPRLWGHAVTVVSALLLLAIAMFGWRDELKVLPMTFQAGWGVLLLVLGHYSWRGSRSAWSLLPPSLGLLTLLGVFAAPMMYRALVAAGHGTWMGSMPLLGLVLPALFAGGFIGILRASPAQAEAARPVSPSGNSQ